MIHRVIHRIVTRGIGLLIWLILLSSHLQAQQDAFTIKGTVYESNGESLPFASVSVKMSKEDVKPFRGVLSNEAGLFELKGLPPGTYVLQVSMIGYRPLERAMQLSANIDLGRLVLETDATVLGEVTVTARPRVVERQADRFVVDVGASTFQTSSVMEIFMAMPFMQVQGEQIAINGKRNILVLLDNVPVPGATLRDVLNSMNGNEIDKIDFITTPSARYDASVDAVINIRTKRALAQGLTGRLNGTYSRGDYGRGNVGGNLTYRKEKWTVDGRYSFNRNDNMVTLVNARQFDFLERSQSIAEKATEFYDNRVHNVKLGVGYQINESHQITLIGNQIRGRIPNVMMTGINDFSRVLSTTTDSVLMRVQDREVSTNIQNYSLNYLGKLDSMGKQVEFIVTYTPIKNDSYTWMRYQEMRLPNGTLQSELPRVSNNNLSKAHVVVVQSDWALPFWSGWQVNTGFKFSSSRNSTETLQFEFIEGNWQLVPDFTFMNRFYEDIVAGYVETQKQFGKTLIKAGLRVENTEMGVEGVYERDFLDFFPNATVQQNFGSRKITLNYRRSISRPGFEQMTPFRIYRDEYLIVEGNMNVRPMYAHEITLNGNVVKDLFLEIGYVQERDLVMQLPRQEGEVTVYAPMNMDNGEWSSNISYSHQIFPWWDANGYVRGYRYVYRGVLNNDYISESGYSYNFGLTSTFHFPSNFTIDAVYNYYAPYGYAGWNTLRTNFARLAVRKDLLQKRVQIVLAFNDIFTGQRYRSNMTAGNLYLYNVNYNDSQRISLGFLLNFGKTTVKAAENKKLGNEDVINRAN